MTENFIRVAPDSDGKRMRTRNQTIAGNDVHTEAVFLADPDTGDPIPNGVERTPGASVATTSGSIAAGARSVQIIPSTDFSGTLLGNPWPGVNAIVGWTVSGNDTLAAISYTIAAGSLTILTVT